MAESIIIIGAGMAGLSAGCYGQMNGYATRIFEMHGAPGGLCTAWSRNGYTFDPCIRWLHGSGPADPMHRVWYELGALQNRPILHHEAVMHVEGNEGRRFTLWTDINRLAKHLFLIAPEDRDQIREFLRDLRRLSRLRPSPASPRTGTRISHSLRNTVGRLPHVGRLRRWSRVTVREFADDLDNPFLREAFPVPFDLPDYPMSNMMLMLAAMHRHECGYPMGGSLPFAQAVAARYESLGGRLELGKHVQQILVEENRAVGVRLADGTEHRADVIISAADGHATIFDLLGGEYATPRIRSLYEEHPVFPSQVFVGLGTHRPLTDLPHTVSGLSIPLANPTVIDCERIHRVTVQSSAFDPSLAPAGKVSLKLSFPSDYARWSKLCNDPTAYRIAKEGIVHQTLSALDQRFPGLSSDVETIDVATPATWHRMTGNWQGSTQGWLPAFPLRPTRWPRRLPGLSDFHMIGQWTTTGGGLALVALSGREAIQRQCTIDRRRFATSDPQ